MPNETVNPETGEIIETAIPTGTDLGVIDTLERASIDMQITTAKRYPRSIQLCRDMIMSLVTYNEESAAEAIYALPRGGKPIKGPSIRLAEIIAQCWGNNRVDARVVAIDRVNKVIIAEATYHDLQTNAATRRRIPRRISNNRGQLYNDDMIVVTGNAACSIAIRNAILSGVPKAIWWQAYVAAERTVAGDIKTLATRRDDALKAFAMFGVKPEQVFSALGVTGIEDITLEHIPTLLGMHSAIKSGEATVEEVFDPRRSAVAKQFEVIKNPLKDEPATEAPKNE